MACTIADKLLDAGGAAQQGLYVYAYPADNTVRIKDGGGTLRPIAPNPNLTVGASIPPYAVVSAASAVDGSVSLAIPDSTSQDPAGTVWNVVLPLDGRTLQGAPLAAGTYTLQQLLAAGWVWAAGQTGIAPTDGREAHGEVSLQAATQYQIALNGLMSSVNYSVSVSFQTDTVNGGAPVWSWESRSTSGVIIKFSQAYTGVMTWRLRVN